MSLRKFFSFVLALLLIAVFIKIITQNAQATGCSTSRNMPRSQGYCTACDNSGNCPCNSGYTLSSDWNYTSACRQNTGTFIAMCCIANPPTPTPVPANCYNAGGFCTSTIGDCVSNGDTAGDGAAYNCGTNFCCLPKTCGQIGGTCTNSLNQCTSNNDTVYDGSGLSCPSTFCCVPNPPAPPPPPPPGECNNSVSCNSCSGAADNTCNVNGSQQCYNTQPEVCIQTPYYPSCSYNNCSAGYSQSNGGGNGCACVTSIYAHVTNLFDLSGLAGTSITDNGGNYQTTDGNGNIAGFSGKTTGSYTISISTFPTGYQAASPTSVGINLANGTPNQTADFNASPRIISGNVYVDLNHDNSKNYNDFFASGIVVSDGVTTTTTDGSGNYYFGCPYGSCLGNASYTVSVVFNGNWSTYTKSPGTSNAQTVSPNPSVGANFIVTPQYQIGGYVYTDKDQDAIFDHSDTAIAGVNVNVNGTNYTTDSNGYFVSAANLISGAYNLSYTLTANQASQLYRPTTPLSRGISVGQSTANGYVASGNGDTEAHLNKIGNPESNAAGDVNNVNFGIINDNQTKQGICSDTRNDNNSGTYYEPLPASYSCGGINQNYADIQNGNCSNGAGIIYSCDGLFNFGLGSAGNPSWTAGGSTPECFNPVNPKTFRSSYEYLLQTAQSSDIKITDLSTVCNTQDCQLPNSLASGIYETTSKDTNNGDLHLDLSSALPGPDTTKSDYTPYGYIILVYGDLYLENNVIVPDGTVLAFGVKGNINVAQNVGNAVNSSTVGTSSVNTTNLEGIYSADSNFIIHSYSETNGGQKCNNDGTSLDNKLDIVGTVITGANDGGGSLVNNRDLCTFDQQCPVLSYGDGLNSDAGNLAQQLINSIAIGTLSHQVYSQHEVAP